MIIERIRGIIFIGLGRVNLLFARTPKVKRRTYNLAEITLTNDNFSETVLRSGKTVLVDFWAEWCGPCRMLAPVIEEIARDHAEITVGKVNVDEQPALASMFGITSIPTVIVFKNGQVSDSSVGFRQKSELEQML